MLYFIQIQYILPNITFLILYEILIHIPTYDLAYTLQIIN